MCAFMYFDVSRIAADRFFEKREIKKAFHPDERQNAQLEINNT